MSTEPRRRRGILREVAGEAWGLAVEALTVVLAVAVALGLAAFILLVM